MQVFEMHARERDAHEIHAHEMYISSSHVSFASTYLKACILETAAPKPSTRIMSPAEVGNKSRATADPCLLSLNDTPTFFSEPLEFRH